MKAKAKTNAKTNAKDAMERRKGRKVQSTVLLSYELWASELCAENFAASAMRRLKRAREAALIS